MSRSRVAAVLGVAFLLVVSAWGLTAVVVRRAPVDLGPIVVVSTGGVTPGESTTAPPASPSLSPFPMATSLAPEPTTGKTTAIPAPGSHTSEAIPVPKAPAPVAGDDDDDDDDGRPVIDDDDDDDSGDVDHDNDDPDDLDDGEND